MGKNGETICGLLDEFDKLAERLDIAQDNAHRAAWLEYNQLAIARHAWWESDGKGGNICSACGCMVNADYAYCPKCGAMMHVRRR